MHRDDQRVMAGRQLHRATRHQLARILAGDHEFAEPLERDQREDEFGETQAACRSVAQLAVKPGPSAVNNERAGNPALRARSRTNSTVGADMLP